MGIWITGDIHGPEQLPRRTALGGFEEQKDMVNCDIDENILIICGDFGCVWSNNPQNGAKELTVLPGQMGECRSEKYELDALAKRPFTVVFVDGNHENHVRLKTYPEKIWHGGKVHEIRPNILHLQRGEIYEIQGKKFLAFGGASSHDIVDGILDPAAFESYKEFKKCDALWRKQRKYYRIKNYSWWAEELPSEEEMQNCLQNLEANDYKVDYCITHCAPNRAQMMIRPSAETDILTDFFENLIAEKGLQFSKWFFGHYHANRNLSEEFLLIYEQIVRIL